MLEITKSEYQDWITNRVTKAFLDAVWEVRKDISEAVLEGGYGTQKEEDRAIGSCIGIKQVCDYAVVGMRQDIQEDSIEDKE